VSEKAAIECGELVKRYDPSPEHAAAVAGISLQVATGECFGLLGPNGAGKTTTLEMLLGLLPPTSGTIRLLGTPHHAAIKDRVGVALQQTALPPKLRALETLRLFASFYRKPVDGEALLSSLGLGEQRRKLVRTLSGGQLQRLSVACALIGNPELMLLDEPTSGVDPMSRKAIWQVLRNHDRRQRSVLLTTHSMEEAATLCDRIGCCRTTAGLFGKRPKNHPGANGVRSGPKSQQGCDVARDPDRGSGYPTRPNFLRIDLRPGSTRQCSGVGDR
jgi:ABC-2 type transport system ATP-binding protein